MENKQTEKSQAELYREERKQRMAKAAKKNSKKSPQMAKAGHIAGKVISIIVVIALCIGALYCCLNFFGVPQKVLTATKINGEKVSLAKYNFYYMFTYLNTYQQSANYDTQYGQGMGRMYTGYDSTVSPAEQEYVGELEGYEKPTWADAFKESALQYIRTYVSYAALAEKDGITLTDEQKKSIEEQITSWKDTAAQNDYSLNRFLSKQYGAGVNEKLVREILEEQYLAQNYAENKEKSIKDSITDKQVSEEIKKNLKDYSTFDISIIAIKAKSADVDENATEEAKKAAQTKAKEVAKKSADSLLATVKDSDSALKAAKTLDSKATDADVNLKATTASSITSSYGSSVADWVFDAKRAVGDKAVLETSEGYVVALLNSLPVTDNTKGVDVKHILISFPTDESGKPKTVTDSQKKTYKSKAESVLNEYLKTPTEAKFTELVTNNTGDPGSKENGGLYECVYPGTMVEQFNDWIFDSSRKPGDTGIVETTYGYHVMLYVNNDNPTVSENAAKTALTNAELDKIDKEATGGADAPIERSTALVNWSSNNLMKTISNQYIKTGK